MGNTHVQYHLCFICTFQIGRQPQANNASRSNNTFYFKKKFSRGSIMEIYCVISSNGNRVVSDKAKVNVQSGK